MIMFIRKATRLLFALHLMALVADCLLTLKKIHEQLDAPHKHIGGDTHVYPETWVPLSQRYRQRYSEHILDPKPPQWDVWKPEAKAAWQLARKHHITTLGFEPVCVSALSGSMIDCGLHDHVPGKFVGPKLPPFSAGSTEALCELTGHQALDWGGGCKCGHNQNQVKARAAAAQAAKAMPEPKCACRDSNKEGPIRPPGKDEYDASGLHYSYCPLYTSGGVGQK